MRSLRIQLASVYADYITEYIVTFVEKKSAKYLNPAKNICVQVYMNI